MRAIATDVWSQGLNFSAIFGEGGGPIFYDSFGFNGTTETINVGSPTFTDTTVVTVAAWVYPTGTGTHTAISKWGTDPNRSWDLYHTATNWTFLVDRSGDTHNSVMWPRVLNEWTHVVGVYDGINIKLYINGVNVANEAWAGALETSTGDVIIGDEIAGGFRFSGSIANVMMFDRDLNGTEITSIYNLGVGVNYSSLSSGIKSNGIVAYDMNSNDDTLTDLTGNANTGTKNGSISADGESIEWES